MKNKSHIESKKSNIKHRRRMLSMIGGSAILGSTHDVWLKPVVETVILPAHAQTSTPAIVSDDDDCKLLTIPGGEISCENPIFSSKQYKVDDSNGCPKLITVVNINEPSGSVSSPDSFHVSFIRGCFDGLVCISIELLYPSGRDTLGSDCEALIDESKTVQWEFNTISKGVPVTATTTLTTVGSKIILSEITLQL